MRPPRARCSPSPAGGRGGRGVRVVSAQPQAPQHLTLRAHTCYSPPRPLVRGPRHGARFSPSPAGGRGGRGVRVVSAQTQAPQYLKLCAYSIAPGGEGGVRSTKASPSLERGVPIVFSRSLIEFVVDRSAATFTTLTERHRFCRQEKLHFALWIPLPFASR